MHQNYDPELLEQINELKCIKCGKKQDVIPYKFITEKYIMTKDKYHIYSHESVFVPTCFNCNQKFELWSDYKEGKKRLLIYIMLPIVVVFLILLFSGLTSNPPNVVMIISSPVGLLITIALLAAIFSVIVNSKEINPNKYLKIIKGEVLIKPLSEHNWIPYIEWIESTTIERKKNNEDELTTVKKNIITPVDSDESNGDYIFCRKCRFRIKIENQYCPRCRNPLG